MSFITNIVSNLMLERPSRKKSYADYVAMFESKGKEIERKANSAADNDKNRRRLSHIIGIERWGQSRVRVALGDPFVEEEYAPRHRPAKETSWDDLKRQFVETRAASVALVQELSAENAPADLQIKHNSFGEISTKAWLHYLQFHASTEARSLK